jgi:hypothetical protein
MKKIKTKAEREKDYRTLEKQILAKNQLQNQSPTSNRRFDNGRAQQFPLPERKKFTDSPWLNLPERTSDQIIPETPGRTSTEIELRQKPLQKCSPQQQNQPNETDNGFVDTITGLGILLFLGGIGAAIYYFLFYPVANPGSEYVNLERLSNRNNGVIIGALACFVGFVLTIFGIVVGVANSKR